MEKVKVTSKGQITLPKNLREKLQIREGDYLQAYLRGNELVFKVLPAKAGKEVLLNYGKKHSDGRVKPEEARKILAKVPFSIANRVRAEREEV